MHLRYLITCGLSVAAAFLSVSASENKTEPDIQVIALFPEDNPFGHVVNGEKNGMLLNVTNVSERNVTLINIGGSFHHPETHALVRNISTAKYSIQLPAGSKIQIPYSFYSEFKPGDLRLNLWLEHKTDDETYRIAAYDSVVTIVEPEGSILDFKLISTYLVIALISGALSYLVFLSFFPATKKSRSKKPPPSTPSVASSTAVAGGYEEEWIPEHHIKKTKAGKRKNGVATSGDEQSGPDNSGTEVKARKGKK